VYWCAGWLSRVKTYQRTYELISEPGDPRPEFRQVERMWVSCQLSMWLLEQSVHLDPKHWDHWALVHDPADGPPCPDCGGILCELEDE
jgi:hypothetical protein